VTGWPQPTRADHEKLCEAEGWTPLRNARGRTGTHPATHEFALPDGRILRTRISHPADRTDYGPRIWGHILINQLRVSEEQFWACVQGAQLPPRGTAATHAVGSIPARVIRLLLSDVGLPEAEVRQMDKRVAIERLNENWTTGQ
jgi:hypothetical protein